MSTVAAMVILVGCSNAALPDREAAADAASDSTPAGSAPGESVRDASLTSNDAGAVDSKTDAPSPAAEDAESSVDAAIPPCDGGADAGACCNVAPYSSGDFKLCSVGQDYTCGGDRYEIECSCPTAACQCRKNGIAVGKAVAFAACPDCTAPNFKTIAQACAAPY